MVKTIVEENEIVPDDSEFKKFFETIINHVPNFINSFPASDFYDDGDKYILEVEVPGINQENIHIEMDGYILKIHTYPENQFVYKGKYFLNERRQEGFTRYYSLPTDIQVGKISKTLDKGLLYIIIPKQ